MSRRATPPAAVRTRTDGVASRGAMGHNNGCAIRDGWGPSGNWVCSGKTMAWSPGIRVRSVTAVVSSPEKRLRSDVSIRIAVFPTSHLLYIQEGTASGETHSSNFAPASAAPSARQALPGMPESVAAPEDARSRLLPGATPPRSGGVARRNAPSTRPQSRGVAPGNTRPTEPRRRGVAPGNTPLERPPKRGWAAPAHAAPGGGVAPGNTRPTEPRSGGVALQRATHPRRGPKAECASTRTRLRSGGVAPGNTPSTRPRNGDVAPRNAPSERPRSGGVAPGATPPRRTPPERRWRRPRNARSEQGCCPGRQHTLDAAPKRSVLRRLQRAFGSGVSLAPEQHPTDRAPEREVLAPGNTPSTRPQSGAARRNSALWRKGVLPRGNTPPTRPPWSESARARNARRSGPRGGGAAPGNTTSTRPSGGVAAAQLALRSGGVGPGNTPPTQPRSRGVALGNTPRRAPRSEGVAPRNAPFRSRGVVPRATPPRSGVLRGATGRRPRPGRDGAGQGGLTRPRAGADRPFDPRGLADRGLVRLPRRACHHDPRDSSGPPTVLVRPDGAETATGTGPVVNGVRGGGDEVGVGEKTHQRKKAPVVSTRGPCSVATGPTRAGRGGLRGRLPDVSRSFVGV